VTVDCDPDCAIGGHQVHRDVAPVHSGVLVLLFYLAPLGAAGGHRLGL